MRADVCFLHPRHPHPSAQDCVGLYSAGVLIFFFCYALLLSGYDVVFGQQSDKPVDYGYRDMIYDNNFHP